MRLAKYISSAGCCSRRAASRLIEQGQVKINGELANHLSFTDQKSLVTVNDELITPATQKHYWIYHKPVGVDCNLDINDPASLIHHIGLPCGSRLFAVGRQDKDSHGLLLLTNDGELCHRLLSPQFKQSKIYQVKVSPHYWRVAQGTTELDDDFANALSQGVKIDGQLTLPCVVTITGLSEFKIELTQGLNRQIRKMAASQGYQVIDLQRTHFATLTINQLAPHAMRPLSSKEILQLTQ